MLYLDVKFFKDLLVLRKNKFIKLSKRKAINITVNFWFLHLKIKNYYKFIYEQFAHAAR